jgi:hypothetical protein
VSAIGIVGGPHGVRSVVIRKLMLPHASNPLTWKVLDHSERSIRATK